MTKKTVTIAIINLLVYISLFANGGEINSIQNFEPEIYYKLCGVWDTSPDMNMVEGEFSWGKGRFILNNSVIIDLGHDPPYLLVSGLTGVKIVSIEEFENNRFKMDILRKHFSGKYEEKLQLIVTLEGNGTIWFNSSFAEFGLYGQDNPYYKISGPHR